MGSENKDLAIILQNLRADRASAHDEVQRLTAKLAAYDQAISAISVLTGAQAAPSATQAKNQRKIWEEARDLMLEVGQDMSHSTIVERLLARGIATDSPTPANIVHSAMSRQPEVFVRVKRGVWGLRSAHPELVEKPAASGEGDL
jgi:hypothetical protein